jgi:hypothetical protein
MILELIVVGVGGILVGIIIGYPIYKKTKILDKIENRARNKILNDPELLKKELDKNSIYETNKNEDTVKLVPVVIEKDGKKVLEIKKEPFKLKTSTLSRSRTKTEDQASENLKRQSILSEEDLDRQVTETTSGEGTIEDAKEETEDGRL